MKAFGRRVYFITEERTLKYPPSLDNGLEIEFEINFDEDSDGNVGHIRFFNLMDKTIQKLKKDTPFVLKAGYKDDYGNILPGVISSQRTKWDGSDKLTEIIVGDETNEWLQTTINKTWKANITAKRVAEDIIETSGLNVGEINLNNPKKYAKGKTFSTLRKTALEEIVKDTESKLHVARGRVYIRPKEKGMQEVVLLNKDTGLISSPQEASEGEDETEKYKFESLLNYRIYTDTIVKIKSKTANGLYRVKNGKHLKSGGDYITEGVVEAV